MGLGMEDIGVTLLFAGMTIMAVILVHVLGVVIRRRS